MATTRALYVDQLSVDGLEDGFFEAAHDGITDIVHEDFCDMVLADFFTDLPELSTDTQNSSIHMIQPRRKRPRKAQGTSYEITETLPKQGPPKTLKQLVKSVHENAAVHQAADTMLNPDSESSILIDSLLGRSGLQENTEKDSCGIATLQVGTGAILNSNGVFEKICEAIGRGDLQGGRSLLEHIGQNLTARLQWKAAVCKSQQPHTVEFAEGIPHGHPRMLIQGCALSFDDTVILHIQKWQPTIEDAVVRAETQTSEQHALLKIHKWHPTKADLEENVKKPMLERDALPRQAVPCASTKQQRSTFEPWCPGKPQMTFRMYDQLAQKVILEF